MIAEMDQLLVVGRKRFAHELLTELQSLGMVQIDPVRVEPLSRFSLGETERQTKDRWEALVARSEGLIDTLGLGDVAPAGRNTLPSSAAEMQSYLDSVGAQVNERVAERSEIRDELELIRTYLPLFRELAPSMAQLDSSRYLYGAAFIVPAGDMVERLKGALQEAFEERYVLALRPFGRAQLAITAVMKDDRQTLATTLSRLGLSELRLPDRYSDYTVAKAVHVMEERSQKLPKRLKGLETELGELAEQHGAKLRALYEVAVNHQTRYEALEDLAEGRYSFALQGWVPSENREEVVSELKKEFGESIIIEHRAADEHHDHNVPVKLENPDWAQPFEGLLALFAPPRYGNFDPTWTLALFFPLLFGIVVGDIAYGLIYLFIGWSFIRRGRNGKDLGLGPLGITIPAGVLPKVGKIITWCAAWSITWGFIYGEFFGNFLEYWPSAENPIFYPIWQGHGTGYGYEVDPLFPIILFRVEQFTPMLIITLLFGVVQVLGGWGIRTYYGYKHGDSKHMWEGIGMFSGIFAVVVFATGFLTDNINTFVAAFTTLGLAIFLLSVYMSGVVLMLVEIISNSGNILSYLRIFAVGLSAALVANLATNLGFAISGTAPIIGPILGIIAALIVHLLTVTLTLIGHTMQPLRLQYVEFFTKFGFYEESGRPYNPFRLLGGKA